MALLQTVTYKGIPEVNTYIKIVGYNTFEEEGKLDDDGNKLYTAIVQIKIYSDQEKKNLLEKRTIDFDDIHESDVSLSGLYSKIKTLKEYKTATDV